MFTRVFVRRAAITTLLVLTGYELYLAHPTWAQAIGADVWNLSKLERETREAKKQSRELMAFDFEIQQRIAIKEMLIGELIAGRSSLSTTTDAFLDLNRSTPYHMDVIRSYYPGHSDREVIARNVIAYTTGRTHTAQEEMILQARLARELTSMIAMETLLAH